MTLKENPICCCEVCLHSDYLELCNSEGATTEAFASDQYEVVPAFDEQLFKKGQQFFHENFFSCFVSHLMGLICILAVESILKVLVLTGASSTPDKAFRRYTNTLIHLKHWYQTNDFQDDKKGYSSMQKVRMKHRVSKQMSEKHLLQSISQLDMLITQWAFVGPIVLKPKSLGIREEPVENIEGFIYFWKIVGYLLGMHDRFNLCNGNLEEVRKRCVVISHHIIIPCLKNPPDQFKQMTYSLVKGTSKFIPPLNYNSFVNFIYNRMNLPLPHEEKNWPNTCNNLILLLDELFHVPILGAILRYISNIILRLVIGALEMSESIRNSNGTWKSVFDFKISFNAMTTAFIVRLVKLL